MTNTSATAGRIDSPIACNIEFQFSTFLTKQFPVESSLFRRIEESASFSGKKIRKSVGNFQSSICGQGTHKQINRQRKVFSLMSWHQLGD